MRVMIDTNILISFGMFRSAKIRQALEIAWDVDNTLLIPDYVIAEARDVVARKWPARMSMLEALLGRIRYEIVNVPDEVAVDLAIRDPRDLPVLRAAIAGRADVLVTGDQDFTDASTGGIPVFTPADFVNKSLSGQLE